MGKKELIESGVLELYVLDTASAEVVEQVEGLMHEPEVKEELHRIELNLERLGMENAVQPPTEVERKVMAEITAERTSNRNIDSGAADSGVAAKLAADSAKVIDLQGKIKRWRNNFAVAASLAGLLALGLGWQLLNKNNMGEMNARMASLEQQIEKLSGSNAVFTDQLAYINHTYTTPIVLKGTQVSPNSKAVVYWNPKVDEALLSTNGLPKLKENQVYQIWADIDGKMVSMKVFTLDEKLVELPYMPKAESLNITVEPKGGSDHPNVEQLYVNAPTQSL